MTVVFPVMGSVLFGAVACFVLFMSRTDSLMSMSGNLRAAGSGLSEL